MKNNTLNKIIDYTKYIFKFNWSTGVILFGLLCSTAYFYIQNKDYKSKLDKIPEMEERIKNQQIIISGLKSSNETFNNVIKSFMEIPPSTLKSEIDGIKVIMKIFHPSIDNVQPVVPDSVKFTGNRPPLF